MITLESRSVFLVMEQSSQLVPALATGMVKTVVMSIFIKIKTEYGRKLVISLAKLPTMNLGSQSVFQVMVLS